MQIRLEKRAVVLAASRGLGRGIALALGDVGCDVAICARDEQKLATAAEELTKRTGSRVLGIPCDLSSPEEIDSFFGQVDDEFGGVDILVTNSGGPPAGSFTEVPMEAWQVAHQSTVMSVVRSALHVIPGMRERRWGRIITLTSTSVRQPIPNLALSNAYRPAVAGLTKTLALELAADGIRAHCVMPGSFLTDRGRSLCEQRAEREDKPVEEVIREMEQKIPVGRMGEPEELGRVVAFLASDLCGFMNGTTIAVDGGKLACL